MPLANDLEPAAVRMQVALRRRPLDNKLEVRLDVQSYTAEGKLTTLQEGHFTVGDDMLFDRLQEHTNNYLRRLVNEHNRLENEHKRRM